MERQIPICNIRIPLNFYTNHHVRVAWSAVMSNYFLAANGVKQGGVLSPILFVVFILMALIVGSSCYKAGCGCYVGKHFMGALAYADDIVLLSPSPIALRKMLEICDTYALDYNICFNAKKSKCLIVAPYSQHYLRDYYRDCSFCIANNLIETVDSFTHN
jgi:Reverse transcriptase (RNA-dependent DNA polymerase)